MILKLLWQNTIAKKNDTEQVVNNQQRQACHLGTDVYLSERIIFPLCYYLGLASFTTPFILNSHLT